MSQQSDGWLREKMTNPTPRAAFTLLDVQRPLTEAEDRALSDACRHVLALYRAECAVGPVPRALRERARRAFLHLGGDPSRSSASLKDYDAERHGPFLGVSDEGSAAAAIRTAAFASPKVRAVRGRRRPAPLFVGVAVDAERLGGIGEVAVGPDEYADIWLACVDRVLVTANIGTRVNVRVYRREPRVVLRDAGPEAMKQAKAEIAAAFKPFVETIDKKPRPLTVFVDIPRTVRMTRPQREKVLRELGTFVRSGQAAGTGKRAAPMGQALGLVSWVGRGLKGRDESMAAIDLASASGLGTIVLDGVKRKAADQAISLAGLLDYFEPGIVGPLLRRARDKGVRLRVANLPDTDTIARGIWAGLNTARSMGVNLGKYGCFPLTHPEVDRVVEAVQGWLPHWSAAPVFFVDHGLLREGGVDVGKDLPRGLKIWLTTVAKHGVRVVLIDTIDKATGRRLLRKDSNDPTGFLGRQQLVRIDEHARRLGVKVLWAGGLGLRDAFEMGTLGVFGIYVTSAAATTVPVSGVYARDPGLAGVKEPSKEAVLRTKILLEAGFLSAKLTGTLAARIDRGAQQLLAALDAGDAEAIRTRTKTLATLCITGWRAHWRFAAPLRGANAAHTHLEREK